MDDAPLGHGGGSLQGQGDPLVRAPSALSLTIATRGIRRGTFDSVPALEAAIESYLRDHNAHCKPFVWTATADTILQRSADSANERQGQDTSDLRCIDALRPPPTGFQRAL